MSTYTVKKQKWVADTKIGRKLHNVLETKDGQILIEYDEVVPDMLSKIQEAMDSFSKAGGTPATIIVSPQRWNELLNEVTEEDNAKGGSPSKMSIHGIEVKQSNYIEDDKLLLVNKGNK